MFFRSKDVFNKSLQSLYKNDVRTNGEFYVDSMLNEAIALGYKVKNFEIDNYICWGTPRSKDIQILAVFNKLLGTI